MNCEKRSNGTWVSVSTKAPQFSHAQQLLGGDVVQCDRRLDFKGELFVLHHERSKTRVPVESPHDRCRRIMQQLVHVPTEAEDVCAFNGHVVDGDTKPLNSSQRDPPVNLVGIGGAAHS
jgi:hypothetical protein